MEDKDNRKDINKHIAQCYIDIERHLLLKLRLLGIYGKEDLKNHKVSIEILNHPDDKTRSLQTYIVDDIEILQVQWIGPNIDIYDAWNIEQEKGDLTQI